MDRIRVLLVDDHQIFLTGLRSFLEKQEDIIVVGEAQDGRIGVLLSGDLIPDVVLVDVTMRELNGMETTGQILERVPKARVIALSAHSEPQLVAAMLRAGAAGYLLKSCDATELMRAIRTVANGQYYLSPDVTGSVVDGYLGTPNGPATNPGTGLSAREREVLHLLAEGKSNREIGVLLQVSHKTVETYRRRLMEKLDLHTVAELVKYALREGLTSTIP